MKRDFDFEVRVKAEEFASRKEKEVSRKYKLMYERERKELEEKLKSEMD